jgi:DsbC/DsbD-like thiol-disulfide interchange protein
MKRRNLLQLPLAIIFTTTVKSESPPWSIRLLKGGFDGKNYWAGLAITLALHWKTYWRVPGDGGIAPQIDVTMENGASHIIHFPIPARYEDAAGMTIGYKNEVIFPIALQPMNDALPVKLSLKAFIGVCDEVCIPAQFEGEMLFSPSEAAAPDQAVISQWQAKVPVLSVEGPIAKATVEVQNEKLVLLLDSFESLADVFIEGNTTHYFGKPDLAAMPIRIPVHGAKISDELRGTPLRITFNTGARALEQTVTVR